MKSTAPAQITPPATVNYPVTLKMTEDEVAYLTGIATRLGWDLPRFLEAFIHDTLPVQRMHRAMAGAVTPETVHVEVVCPALAARLDRVAAFNGMDVDEWLLSAIGSKLEHQEAQMIFDPKTGDVIGDLRRVFQAVRL